MLHLAPTKRHCVLIVTAFSIEAIVPDIRAPFRTRRLDFELEPKNQISKRELLFSARRYMYLSVSTV